MSSDQRLENRTIVVTGATSGIGLAAVKELARRGAQILGVGRSEERCAAATEEIRGVDPDAKITYALADLSLIHISEPTRPY